jgi:hypothetical protein
MCGTEGIQNAEGRKVVVLSEEAQGKLKGDRWL